MHIVDAITQTEAEHKDAVEAYKVADAKAKAARHEYMADAKPELLKAMEAAHDAVSPAKEAMDSISGLLAKLTNRKNSGIKDTGEIIGLVEKKPEVKPIEKKKGRK